MSQDAKWMVRSGGRISGPYSKRQIPELLKSREVHLRDEVSEPFSRWITLEFHSQFADEVDAFKREIHSEKTEVSLTPAETTGFGITQTTTDLADSELTQEITHDLSGFTNTKEIVIDDVQDTPGAQKRNLEAAQYQLKGLDSSPYLHIYSSFCDCFGSWDCGIFIFKISKSTPPSG
jgi:hypothetical protein